MTRESIKFLIVNARKAEERKRKYGGMLIDNLERILGDLENIPNNSAENASNLKEAILCHIDYGECDLKELLDDIEKALAERRENNG